ncbi:MAG: sel1 repeat family protein [Candidatus Obscuribacter sp.]|jgi:TPR repeat protein|nr:sel1 repeat family protein [Candidatus Obscuribacter sp.]MBL0187650.1 sel1 repeat family protein [Candidatus Obscuribacter sp.]MDQ5966550.1 Sel1 repeat family protein [Cyanobacteriota bacterium erpe_2018_sw_39hr_WHONDRS-SW48-000098_B_bin.30]
MVLRSLYLLCAFSIFSISAALADPPEHLLKAQVAMQRGDYHSAYGILHRAAKGGCKYSATILGKMHHTGVGAKKDIYKAIKYFELAAEQNFGEAQYELGKIYAIEMNYLRRSGLKAKRWLRMAADNGIVEAKVLLAKIPYEDKVEAKLKAFKKRASDAASASQTGVVESYKGYADIVNTLNQATGH